MELLRPSSLDELDGGHSRLAGGTEVVPQLRDGLLEADALVDVLGLAPARHRRHAHRRGHDARRARGRSDEVPDALREACRLAASPQLRSMGTVAGNLLQATRCWYWRLKLPVPPARRRRAATRATASTASTRSSPTTSAPRRIRPMSRRRSLALGATLRTNRRELPVAELYRAADRGRPAHDDARARRADPRARRAAAATRPPT